MHANVEPFLFTVVMLRITAKNLILCATERSEVSVHKQVIIDHYYIIISEYRYSYLVFKVRQ